MFDIDRCSEGLTGQSLSASVSGSTDGIDYFRSFTERERSDGTRLRGESLQNLTNILAVWMPWKTLRIDGTNPESVADRRIGHLSSAFSVGVTLTMPDGVEAVVRNGEVVSIYKGQRECADSCRRVCPVCKR